MADVNPPNAAPAVIACVPVAVVTAKLVPPKLVLTATVVALGTAVIKYVVLFDKPPKAPEPSVTKGSPIAMPVVEPTVIKLLVPVIKPGVATVWLAFNV